MLQCQSLWLERSLQAGSEGTYERLRAEWVCQVYSSARDLNLAGVVGWESIYQDDALLAELFQEFRFGKDQIWKMRLFGNDDICINGLQVVASDDLHTKP